MSETTVTDQATEDTAAPSTGDSTPAPTPEAPVQESATDAGTEALGDAGKKALDAMKAKWKTAEAESKRVADELAALKAAAEGKQAEYEAQQRAREVESAALAKADERILKAEIRAAAAAKLADPADALRFLDLSEFEVGSDGDVDSAAVNAAIDVLITSKPYLAAQGGPRFQGDADAGARNDASKAQLTRDDLSRMSPDEINAARTEGRLDDLLGKKH